MQEGSGIARFELLRPLGSGAMGHVFEARERESGACVALKVLRHHDGSALYRFKQEFRVLADISHPNVVRFGELFEDAGRFYLTMELWEGEDFLSYVRPGATRSSSDLDATREDTTRSPEDTRAEVSRKRASVAAAQDVHDAAEQDRVHDGVLDVERLRHALRQLCSGLVALHAAGLVHRDVKPHNILVTQDGRLVLLDFGIAVDPRDNIGERSEMIGTIAYMAPEQVDGTTVSAATDWYAVGVTLYEALTGRLPGSTSTWQAFAHKQRLPRPPSAYVGGLPDDLCALCIALLEPDPAARPDDAQVARVLGLDLEAERARASFRSQLQFASGLFVGRETELATLHDTLASSRERGCTIVRIAGDSGAGKSALLRRFTEQLKLTEPDALVLTGRCYERETVPYRGLDRVVDDLAQHLREAMDRGESVFVPRGAGWLGQVFPVLRSLQSFARMPTSRLAQLDPYEARRFGLSALRELMSALADERAVVVHIDDAQWIDAESIDLLAFLALGESAPRMLLVMTEWPVVHDGYDPLQRLADVSGGVSRLALGPLSPLEGRALAAALLQRDGVRADLDPAQIAEQSGGQPMFIHELVRHAAVGRGHPRGMPSVEHALSARIDALDPACRRLLELLSLASAPLPHAVARTAAQMTAELYPWALTSLRAENLVSFYAFAPGEEVQIYHDRIRELVTAHVNEAARRNGHEQLARAFEVCLPEARGMLAHHFWQAGIDDKAGKYAREAAESAFGALAFEQAARFYELALRVAPDELVRAELEERLGHVLANAGHGLEAAESYLRAAQRVPYQHALDLRRRAGEQLLRSGHAERGLWIVSDVLRQLGMGVPQRRVPLLWSLARGLGWLALRGLKLRSAAPALTPEQALRLETCFTSAVGLSMIDQLRATDFQLRSLRLALEAGERVRALRSMAVLGATLSLGGSFERRVSRKLLSAATYLLGQTTSAEDDAWLALTTGIAAMASGDFAKCELSCGRAQAVFRDHCTGVAWELVTAQAFVLWSMAYQGKLRSIAERLPEMIEQAGARGDRYALATLTLGPLHIVGLAADEPERVRRECADTAPSSSTEVAHFQRLCAAYVLGQVDLYEGRATEAWERVAREWPLLRRTLQLRVRFYRIDFLGLRARAALARAAGNASERRRWLRRARADARRLEREDLGVARAMAMLVRAGIDWQSQRSAHALAWLARAHAEFESQGMALHATLAALAHARISGNRDAGDSAEHALAELGVRNLERMFQLWLPGVG